MTDEQLTAPETDVIDQVMGITPGSFLDKLRAQRPKIRHYTQTSYDAALRPPEPRNFPYALRAALAARMARLWRSEKLARYYLDLAAREGADGAAAQAADPAFDGGADDWLRHVLARVDLVTLRPREATGADVEALRAAGLDDRDIVTLAGLIAYVNYQILVIAGLQMLKDY